MKNQVFLKIHGSSVPNHNFREVLSEGGCCRRRKFYIENSKTSFVLKGLYQEKKSFLAPLFAFCRASIVSKKFILSFCFFKASKVKEDIQRKQEK